MIHLGDPAYNKPVWFFASNHGGATHVSLSTCEIPPPFQHEQRINLSPSISSTASILTNYLKTLGCSRQDAANCQLLINEAIMKQSQDIMYYLERMEVLIPKK
jgi:hypothetical protein